MKNFGFILIGVILATASCQAQDNSEVVVEAPQESQAVIDVQEDL